MDALINAIVEAGRRHRLGELNAAALTIVEDEAAFLDDAGNVDQAAVERLVEQYANGVGQAGRLEAARRFGHRAVATDQQQAPELRTERERQLWKRFKIAPPGDGPDAA